MGVWRRQRLPVLTSALPPLARMWTSSSSPCRRATASSPSGSSTRTLSSRPSGPTPSRRTTGTPRTGGSGSTSPGTAMGPGSPGHASPHGGPPACTRGFPTLEGIIQQLVNGIIAPTTIPNLGVGPWGVLHSNPMDYAWGANGLDAIITQLLNQFENTGPPPADKEKIQALPTIHITEEHVGESWACCYFCCCCYCIYSSISPFFKTEKAPFSLYSGEGPGWLIFGSAYTREYMVHLLFFSIIIGIITFIIFLYYCCYYYIYFTLFLLLLLIHLLFHSDLIIIFIILLYLLHVLFSCIYYYYYYMYYFTLLLLLLLLLLKGYISTFTLKKMRIMI
uniref:Uncharacterized protein n=1 Tax=Anolis carolinensis TaxID=28377 RepID=H9G7U5_ANOCA